MTSGVADYDRNNLDYLVRCMGRVAENRGMRKVDHSLLAPLAPAPALHPIRYAEAFVSGKQAAEANEPVDSCPHRDESEERVAWLHNAALSSERRYRPIFPIACSPRAMI